MDETAQRQGVETIARPGPGRVPRHVALVLGDVEAWERLGSLPTEEAHRVGRRVLVPLLGFVGKAGVEAVTLVVPSTGERGPRRSAEALLEALAVATRDEVPETGDRGIRVEILGRRDRLSPRVVREVDEAGRPDRGDRRLKLYVDLDHSGRGEVAGAVRGLLAAGVGAEEVDEAAFARRLSAPEATEVDLMVVTGGGRRLPDALLWQTAYAEFYFTGAPWPETSADDLERALASYAGRSRRRGGI